MVVNHEVLKALGGAFATSVLHINVIQVVGADSSLLFKTGGLSAEEANIPFIKDGKLPPYAEGTRARIIQLQRDRVLVRVHGEGNQPRSWMMRPEQIEGLTAQQIKDKFALPELPSYVS